MLYRVAIALLATLLSAGAAAASPATTATPIYHGVLDVIPARGVIDPNTGVGMLKVRRWRLLPAPDSNGIYPDQEPLLIALAENNYYLAAGSLVASRNGSRFRYLAPRDAGPRAIRSFQLVRRPDGTYIVSFTLTGIELSRLTIQNRDCVPMAVIVGDDDGFSGVVLRRPSFTSRRLLLAGGCQSNNDWPWIQ